MYGGVGAFLYFELSDLKTSKLPEPMPTKQDKVGINYLLVTPGTLLRAYTSSRIGLKIG